MRGLSVTLKVIGGALGIVMLSGASAYAVSWDASWNSKPHPLTVTGYGSTGKGYGWWAVRSGESGTRSELKARLWYHNADNHKVYAKLETWVNAGICAAPGFVSCSQAYYFYRSSNTGHSSTNNDWETETTSTVLPGSGDYARAGVQVVLDVPWRPDPTSDSTWTHGAKY